MKALLKELLKAVSLLPADIKWLADPTYLPSWLTGLQLSLFIFLDVRNRRSPYGDEILEGSSIRYLKWYILVKQPHKSVTIWNYTQ